MVSRLPIVFVQVMLYALDEFSAKNIAYGMRVLFYEETRDIKLS
jgi:hypothetical protein